MDRLVWVLVVASLMLGGCASVPMASPEDDKAMKEFSSPPNGSAGLYIYRNSSFGGALKKAVYIDDTLIGKTAPKTYFYKHVKPGEHKLSTQSEFGNNDLMLKIESGKNYFIRHYIKMGVFVGGANLEPISEEEGKKGVLECKLAKEAEAAPVAQPAASATK